MRRRIKSPRPLYTSEIMITHLPVTRRSQGRLRITWFITVAWFASSASAHGQGFTTVHAFGRVGEPLFKPYSLMQTRDGSLYGATFSGHIYKMTTDGTILRLFNWPDSPCLETRDGVLYGAGSNMVWRANPDGGFTTSDIFDRATDGE